MTMDKEVPHTAQPFGMIIRPPSGYEKLRPEEVPTRGSAAEFGVEWRTYYMVDMKYVAAFLLGTRRCIATTARRFGRGDGLVIVSWRKGVSMRMKARQ